MKPWLARAAAATLLMTAASYATAQQQIIYPAKGQSAKQQQRDQGECQVWATENTGIDPAKLAQTPVYAPTGPAVGGGERLVGATRGALGGLAIGAIAGDAGKGAAIGAVVGTMRGGRRARWSQSSQQQQAQAQRQQQLSTWNRADAACMEARGYTVK